MLEYIGNGKHITGIPARELSNEEILTLAESFGMTEKEFTSLLIERGLYKEPKQPSKAKPKSESEE